MSLRRLPRPRPIPPTRCPHCATIQDTVQGFNFTRPTPGSFLVCCACGALNVLGAAGELRAPTAAEEFAVWSSDQAPLLARALRAVELMNEPESARSAGKDRPS
jgi:hypothetical protein